MSTLVENDKFIEIVAELHTKNFLEMNKYEFKHNSMKFCNFQ